MIISISQSMKCDGIHLSSHRFYRSGTYRSHTILSPSLYLFRITHRSHQRDNNWTISPTLFYTLFNYVHDTSGMNTMNAL